MLGWTLGTWGTFRGGMEAETQVFVRRAFTSVLARYTPFQRLKNISCFQFSSLNHRAVGGGFFQPPLDRVKS